MFFSVKNVLTWAIASGDQVVFTYEKEPGKLATRFVTPMEFRKNDTQIFCRQHSPKDDFRCFELAKVKDVHRVMTKASF